MKPIGLMNILLCLLGIVRALGAQERVEIEHRIQSDYPVQERLVTVQLPQSYHAQPHALYPVLYLLDGASNLAHAAVVAELLAESGLIPEMVIVGLHAGVTRLQDYMPGGVGAGPAQAEEFLDYIQRELMPLIERDYRIAPVRLLSGHSLGGLLATHSMVTRPDLFWGYLAQSPYLTDATAEPLFDRMSDAFEADSELARFYFATLGDEPDLESNFSRLTEKLEKVAPETLTTAREPGASHMSTRLVGLHDGLVRFFGDEWPVPAGALVDGGGGLADHIAALSERYRYPVLLTESVYVTAIQSYLGRRELASAADAAEMYSTSYPASPMAHFLLGVALAQSGDRDGAAASIAIGIELYERAPDPSLELMYENMRMLQRTLAGSD